jgi:hypothetical protein
MIKQLAASTWILTTTAAFILGLNGFIGPTVMVTFSLAALGVLYGFALWTVISNTGKGNPVSSMSDSHAG